VILIDLNQVMISNLMAQLGNHARGEIEEDLFRNMVLNSLRSYRTQFSQEEYGDLVICADDRRYWRRDIFPNYKANRKKTRDESDYDWNHIFGCLNRFRDELKDVAPYRVLQIPHAEADDIIATLCIRHGTLIDRTEKIMILSGDKDFMQLQVYGNVEQYDPVRHKPITTDDPHRYLREHILRGDRGDGIPNIVSDDSCIVEGRRQKPLAKKRVEFLSQIPDLENVLTDEQYANFKRNELLIDLHMVPESIQQLVLAAYEDQSGKDKVLFKQYLEDHNMKILLEKFGDF
jgi:hypothetical protein